MIPSLSDNETSAGTLHALQSHTHLGRRGKPRSVSLTSQAPGTAPRVAIPPLPADAVAIRRQGSIRASALKQNLEGIIRRDAILKSGCEPTKSAEPETGIKSMKLVPPSPAETLRKDGDPFQDRYPHVEDGVVGSTVDATNAQRVTLKAPLPSRKSVRTHLRDSMARSNSSGLSESLLNHTWSRRASDSSFMRDVANTLAKSGTPLDSGLGSHISVFDFGLPTTSDQNDASYVQPDHGEVRNKRHSPSILQVIAGNEQNPRKHCYGERPSSIATENPFRSTKETTANEAIKGVSIIEIQTLLTLPTDMHLYRLR